MKNRKKWLATLTALFAGSVLYAAPQAGAPIFADSFDMVETFAENWTFMRNRAKSEKGQAEIKNGYLTMRRQLPAEFFAEYDITLKHDMKNPAGFAGVMIDGYHFKVQPNGKSFLVWRLKNEKRSKGIYKNIANFALGQSLHCAVARAVNGNRVTYSYYINGVFMGSFDDVLPAEYGKGEFAKLTINSYKVDSVIIDNFRLSALKRSENESPNLTINSSFEELQDGFPLYVSASLDARYEYPAFSMDKALDAIAPDDKVFKSGKRSLRLTLSPHRLKNHVWFHSTGTAVNQSGVLSAWMKADRDDAVVRLIYGKAKKEFKLSKEWRRYEVVCPALPAPGVYPPAKLEFEKSMGKNNVEGATVWVDDVQAEFLPNVISEKELRQALSEGKTFATPYQKSELDAHKFAPPQQPVRAASFSVPMLPAEVKPTAALDSWIKYAVKQDKFLQKGTPAKNRSEAYLACDANNLYVGLRVYGDDLARHKAGTHDDFSVYAHGMEILIDPTGGGKQWMHIAANAAGTVCDIGYGEDKNWNGSATASGLANKGKNSVDTLITIPFVELAGVRFSDHWIMNIGSNDSVNRQNCCLGNNPTGGYRSSDWWPEVTPPAEIVRKYRSGIREIAAVTAMGKSSLAITFDNAERRERKVAVKLSSEDKKNVLTEKIFTLKPGVQTLNLGAVSNIPKRISVMAAENGKKIFDRNFAVSTKSPLAMLGRLNFYMNEPEAVFQIACSLPNQPNLRAELECNGKKISSKAASLFRISMPIADLKPGTYDVSLKIFDGKTLVGMANDKLVKREYWAGAAQINRFSRSVMKNGKGVMPFALCSMTYHLPSKENLAGKIEWNAKEKFRTIHFIFDHRDLKRNDIAQKKSLEHGIQIIAWNNPDWYIRDRKTFGVDDAKMKALADLFGKNYPNILSQMVVDEPELYLKSEQTIPILRKARAVFQYHPVQMNSTVIGINSNFANMETDVLMLDDYLTNGENRTVYSVIRYSDIMWKVGVAEGKPCWYFLVGGNTPLHYKEPSYVEQMAQCYGHIASGGTGISLFLDSIVTPGNLKAVRQLNKEFSILNDVITSDEMLEHDAAISGNPDFMRMRTKLYQDCLYMISVNIDTKTAGAQTITLPAEFKYADSVEVMFENRTIPVKDGKFSDEFPGLSRHVYKIKLKK